MSKRTLGSVWARAFERQVTAMTRRAVKSGASAFGRAVAPAVARRQPPPGAGDWIEVDGLGHAWSGGAAKQPFSDGRGPDASRMAWPFAARQFRR